MKKIAIVYDLDENIMPAFEDYDIIKNIPGIKILVTSKITQVQKAKLEALEIENDFDQIIIDRTETKDKPGKKEIFSGIAAKYNLNPKQVWIVSDNPDKEIAIGNELGMITVLRTQTDQIEIPGEPTFTISSFHDLKKIVTDALKINSPIIK